MNKLAAVFSFDLREQIRRRSYLIMTFGVPLLAILLVLGIQLYQDFRAGRNTEADTETTVDESTRIGYVDHSGHFESPGLFSTALQRFDTEEEAIEALRAGGVVTVYVIAEDYLETGNVTQYVEFLNMESTEGEGVFRAFLMDGLLRGVDRQLARRIQSRATIVEHQIALETGEASAARDEDASFWLVYVFGLTLSLAVFYSGGYVLRSVVAEKESRMLEVLLSSIRPLALLSGKILASGVLGLIQILAWGVVAVFVMSRVSVLLPLFSGVTVPPQFVVWMLVYFVAGFFMFAGLFASVGAISQSTREGPQMAVVFTLPAMLPFYFIYQFVQAPNGTLAVALSLFPLTSPLAMVQRLALTGVPPQEIALSLALLLVSTVGTFWLAARLFRVRTLLAGRTPRLRELLMVIREA
ncbi:MAG: hypothetical protein Kow0077_06060 [Anaerolineae bacterium]